MASSSRGRIAGWVIASSARSSAGSAKTRRRQRRPVERSVGAEDVRPEALDDRRQRRLARLGHLARQAIRIDHDRAPRSRAAGRRPSTCRSRSGRSARSGPDRAARPAVIAPGRPSRGPLLELEPRLLGRLERRPTRRRARSRSGAARRSWPPRPGRPSPARGGSCAARAGSARPRAPSSAAGRPPSTASGRGPPPAPVGPRRVPAGAPAEGLAPPGDRPFVDRPAGPHGREPHPRPPCRRPGDRRSAAGAPRRSIASADRPAVGDRRPPGPVAAVEGRRPAAVDDPQPIAHGLEEAPVVAHDEERGRRLAHERLDRLAGRDVEVVRRLVEQEQVGRHDPEQRQLEPRALAAATGCGPP